MDFMDPNDLNTTNTKNVNNAQSNTSFVSNDNTIVDETLEGSKKTAASNESASQQQQVNLLDVPITDENVALNILVAFINLAQRRGVFNVQESAKVWECIQQFKKSSE
jgi:hypothetical protein